MLTDIEIAQAVQVKPIVGIAKKNGNFIGRFNSLRSHSRQIKRKLHQKLQQNVNGKLILVTSISPTPADVGKTTTTIGLADTLNHIFKHEKTSKQAIVCIREPSLGRYLALKAVQRAAATHK